MKSGSWGSIALVYAYLLLGGISVGKMAPLARDVGAAFQVDAAAVGLAIGLLFFISAFLSTVGGWVMDRLGLKPSLIAAALVIALANVLAYFAPNILLFDLARVLEGLGYVGLVAGGPAFVMATAAGPRRVQGLTILATTVAAGYAMGLLLARTFAGSPDWRATFAVHAGLALLLALAGLLLPRPEIRPAAHRVSLLSIYREMGALRLGLGYGVQTIVGLGVNSVVPIYFSTVRDVPLTQVTLVLLLCNLMNIPAGFLMAFLLGRGWTPWKLMVGACAGVAAAGLVVFTEVNSAAVSMWALLPFFMCIGATVSLCNALLLHVTRGADRGATTTGLVHQMAGICALAAPPIFFAVLGAPHVLFLVLIAVGLLVSLAILPLWGVRSLAREPLPPSPLPN